MTEEIWIVDDDRGVRFVLAEAVRDAGLVVREFGGPEVMTYREMIERIARLRGKRPLIAGPDLNDRTRR